jgi:hypothetical protein
MAHGQFLDITFNVPTYVGAPSKQDTIAHTITCWRQTIAFENDRSFKDKDRLIAAVMPIETTFGAFPNDCPNLSIQALI